MNRPSSSLGTTRLASALTASAIAIGLFAVPATAHAMPVDLQNAVKCDKFALSNGSLGSFGLIQDNGVRASFAVADDLPTEVSGPRSAQYNYPSASTTWGSATGGIKGRTINITVNWTSGPGTGFTNTYTGQVDHQGFSTGTTTNNRGTTNGWRGRVVHNCLEASGTEPAPMTPIPGSKKIGKRVSAPTATVTSDVDLFEQPHGVGKIRILRKGEVAKVARPCVVNDHCELAEPRGFAWGEFLKNN